MQRYTLLFLLSVVLSFTVQAQLTQGTRFLGTASGSAGNAFFRTPLSVYGGLGELSLGVFEDDNAFVLRATPDLGYFLSDNVLLGSTFLLSTITDFDDSFTTIGFIPFARYYFNPESSSNTFFYGQAQAGFILSVDDSDLNAFPFNLGAGATHQLAPGVGLDTYVQLRDFDLSSEGGSSIALGATLNFYLNNEMYTNRQSGTPNMQRGTLMVGGTGGILQFDLEEGGSTAIALEPQLFYFLNPQLAIGAGLQIEFTSVEILQSDFNTTNLGLSPQIRYYFSTGEHRLWFVSGGLNIQYNRFKNPFLNDEIFSDTNVDFGLGAGFNSFITPNVALEIGPSLRIDPNQELIRLGFDVGVQAFLRAGE